MTKVKDIPENLILVDSSEEIEHIEESTGLGLPYRYLFVGTETGEYNPIYGCNSIELNAYVEKIV